MNDRPFLMTHVLRYTSQNTAYITIPKLWGVEPGSVFHVRVTNRETGSRFEFIKVVAARGQSTVIYVPKKLSEALVGKDDLMDAEFWPCDVGTGEDDTSIVELSEDDDDEDCPGDQDQS